MLPSQAFPTRRRTDTDKECGLRRALLGPTLPLVSTAEQRERLCIGDNGVFDTDFARQHKNALAVDLLESAQPSLSVLATRRIKLAYDEASLTTAQAAFLAIAAHGGWPIAADEQSLALLTLAQRIAGSDIPVLVEGPTGTGKEVFARFIHRQSKRADGPFVAVNCAAMPEAMLEGLLFGHRKGAFTGAGEAREGLFRAADGGTLLLDEIGELPLALQAKLLRSLQEGEVLPLGATTPIKVDVRIVACTNRILPEEVAAGRFREDLLYRLNVFPLRLPALRDRPGDVAPIAFGMLLRHGCRKGMPGWLSDQALESLASHPWPGNVRELENVIRRAILLAGEERCIGAEHIAYDEPVRDASVAEADARARDSARSLSDIAFQSEAEAILVALQKHGGHRARTAKALGISERTLRYRLASMRDTGLLRAGAER